MSQHYIFNESGSIPGVPGTFAGVRVDVADDGTLDVQPLPLHPHFEAAEEEALPEEEKAPEEQSTEEAPPPKQLALETPPDTAVPPKEEQAEMTEPEQPTSPPEASPTSGEANSEQA